MCFLVVYKNVIKEVDGMYIGIYYNVYSEDLFFWNNDIENGEVDIWFIVFLSSFSRFYVGLNEVDIYVKLKLYRLSFDFCFIMYLDVENGIEFILFFFVGVQSGDFFLVKLL